jgi:hypothetical protein
MMTSWYRQARGSGGSTGGPGRLPGHWRGRVFVSRRRGRAEWAASSTGWMPAPRPDVAKSERAYTELKVPSTARSTRSPCGGAGYPGSVVRTIDARSGVIRQRAEAVVTADGELHHALRDTLEAFSASARVHLETGRTCIIKSYGYSALSFVSAYDVRRDLTISARLGLTDSGL